MLLRFLLFGLLTASSVHCNIFEDAWDWVEDVASDVGDIFTDIGDEISEVASDVGDEISEVASDVGDVIEDIATDIGDEVVALLDPIGDVISTLVFSQCDLIKSTLGVTYDGVSFPDISSLMLIFKNESLELSMSLTLAAEMIGESSNTYEQNVFIILHGFIASPESDTTAELNQALINQGNTNVFMLDASSLIGFFYLRSTVYIRYIGEALAGVLNSLYKKGVDPKNIHLIGHSLGAHMAGFAGKTFTNFTGKTIGRLSALDPAGPCFTDIDSSAKLMMTDADFVDVLHTNAGIAGNSDVLGHIDYYPNGGSLQPGCYDITCNHGRSWEFFTESLSNSTKFPSIRCESFNDYKAGSCESDISYMGFNSRSSDAHGVYFLITEEASLFDLGELGLVYDSNSLVQTSTDLLVQLFASVGDLIGLDLGDVATSLLT